MSNKAYFNRDEDYDCVIRINGKQLAVTPSESAAEDLVEVLNDTNDQRTYGLVDGGDQHPGLQYIRIEGTSLILGPVYSAETILPYLNRAV